MPTKITISNLGGGTTEWRCLQMNQDSSEFLSSNIEGPRLRFVRDLPSNPSKQPTRREIVLAVPMNTGSVAEPNYQTMSLRLKISTPAGVTEADALMQIDSLLSIAQDDNVKAPFLTSVFMPNDVDTTA